MATADRDERNWRKICRICMDKGRLVPIFGAPIRAAGVKKIANDHSDLIMKYANVRLFKNDALPQNMCYGCLFLLKSADQFKKTCERSNTILSHMLGMDIRERQRIDWSVEDPINTHFREKTMEKIEADDFSGDDHRQTQPIANSVEYLTTRNDHASLLIDIPPIDDSKEESATDLESSGEGDNFVDTQEVPCEFDDVRFSKNSNEGVNLESAPDGDAAERTEPPIRFNSNDRAFMEMLVAHSRPRKKANELEKEKELRGIAEKIISQVGKMCTSTADLRKTVLASQRPRQRSNDKETQEKIRAMFKEVKSGKEYTLAQCLLCGMIVKGSSAHNHAQKHLGYRIMCELCGKAFVSNFGLEQHQMSKHGREKPFTCQFCDYKTGSKFELIIHERSHTGERPFVCDMCGKSFFRRRCMVNHAALHTKIKPHKCEQCPKTFVHRSDLKAHINSSHDRRYVYKCDVCDLSYAKIGTVRKHLTSQHSIPRDEQGKVQRVYIG